MNIKSEPIIITLIAAIALVISATVVADAIKDYGAHLERAAALGRPSVEIPSTIRLSLDFEGGNSPLRLNVKTDK